MEIFYYHCKSQAKQFYIRNRLESTEQLPKRLRICFFQEKVYREKIWIWSCILERYIGTLTYKCIRKLRCATFILAFCAKCQNLLVNHVILRNIKLYLCSFFYSRRSWLLFFVCIWIKLVTQCKWSRICFTLVSHLAHKFENVRLISVLR